MITLRVDNSESSISGLDAKQLKGLRSILSYRSDPKASYYSGNYNTVKYLMDAKGRFPTGLLYLVETYLSSVAYETKDLRTLPERQEGLFKLRLGG